MYTCIHTYVSLSSHQKQSHTNLGVLYDVTNNVSLDHLYGSGGEGRELRREGGGGEGSNNENQTSELQVVHVYIKCTVLQGKRAKLGIFHNYGHDVLIFGFQPTPLGIQVHHFVP